MLKKPLILAAAIFIVDQLIKYWVTGPLGLAYEGAVHYVMPVFQFTLTHNDGIALGFFQAGSETARWALTGILGLITAGVGYWLFTEKNAQDALGLGVIFGGALGNLLDRIRLGYVVDYADLHFGEFRPFLVFNVADAAITIGVLLLIGRSLLEWQRERKAEKARKALETES
jgi:signal peptidase II